MDYFGFVLGLDCLCDVLENPKAQLAESLYSFLHEHVQVSGQTRERWHESLRKETQELVINLSIGLVLRILHKFDTVGVQYLPDHKFIIVHEQVLKTAGNVLPQTDIIRYHRQLV